MMPGMDGPATFRNLQVDPKTRPIPVIFLTAKAGIMRASRYFQNLKVASTIAKPFDATDLANQVMETLGWQ